MGLNERLMECHETVAKLEGKKILEVKFKSYARDCCRLYLTTDKGELIMTFCKDWECPVVEYHK